VSDTPELEAPAGWDGEARVRELEHLVRLCVAGWADAERRAGVIYQSSTPPARVPRWAWPSAEQARRLRALDDFIAEYEAAHGRITEDEVRAAYAAAHRRPDSTGRPATGPADGAS
jgi:hypothetical protein